MANVLPSGWSYGPGGPVHESCIHHLQKGESPGLDEDGQLWIFLKDGKRRKPPQGDVTPDDVAEVRANVVEGWVVYYEAIVSGGSNPHIKRFNAKWNIPTAPKRQSEQAIFFFTSIQPNTTTSYPLIQPVLQWGNVPVQPSGGMYQWSANGYVIYTNQNGVVSFLSTGVSPNIDVVDGKISYTNGSGTLECNSKSLPLKSYPECRAARIVFEVYGANSRDDYPTGDVIFKDIDIYAGPSDATVTHDRKMPIPDFKPYLTINDDGTVTITPQS